MLLRARQAALLCALAAAPVTANAQAAAARPAITGIDHVTLYASDPARFQAFYEGDLHTLREVERKIPGVRYFFNSHQYVEVLPQPAGQPDARFGGVTFATQNAVALETYLSGKGIPVASRTPAQAARHGFTVHDPEGNPISFVQAFGGPAKCYSDVSCHLIHTGFLVRSRAAEDSFYRAILGFRPYWEGAFTPGRVDWVSQQVPDGQDWLEYMMAGDGSDSPLASVDRADLGGKDHISLAVENMEATVTQLVREHRLNGSYNGPKMGLDGKWQTNLYDPDGTRVELMEATPKMDPCCSQFAAGHPSLQAK